MGKLRDWLRGDGDRPRWSRLQYAVAACAEDLQDELQDEWNDWTPDMFAGHGSEDEFDSCSEWDDGEAVDRAKVQGVARLVADRPRGRTGTRTVTRTRGGSELHRELESLHQ